VAWSPDGKKMLFERMNPRHPGVGLAPGDFAEDLHVMNADGSGQRKLTPNPAVDNGVHPAGSWSPDGRKIAFGRQPNNRQRCRRSLACGIWLMNPDGSGQRSLTPAGWYKTSDPDWSPDGSKIAFDGTHRWRGPASTTPSGVFVVNADGSERRRLTQGGGSPAWSPDGRKIAFERDGEIYVMKADGSERRRLTQDGGDIAWSPDGKMIAFERDDATGTELVVMTADGRGERRLMRSDSWGGHGFEWAWSPTQK
jgi:TolB protein